MKRKGARPVQVWVARRGARSGRAPGPPASPPAQSAELFPPRSSPLRLSRGGLRGLSLTSILLPFLIYAAEWNDLP